MTAPGILDLYRGAGHEAFRLEARQDYGVPQESRQWRQWRRNRTIAPDPAVEESMGIIRDLRGQGVIVHRVHVIDLPLTDYLEYELAAYAENIRAGEQVFIAVRAWHPLLAILTQDFTLFDPGTAGQAVTWMHYNPRGELATTTYSTAAADIDAAIELRDLALLHAIPLARFTALADTG